MLKGLLLCTLACGAASPAAAGDKSAPVLTPSVKAVSVGKDRITYGTRKVAPVVASTPDSHPATFAMPAGAAALRPSSGAPLLAGDTRALNTRFVLVHTDAAAWDTPAVLPSVTADAGASYAVTEALNDRYKPRQRRSTIRTVLSLHLDGQEDSPSFSVGGSAVTAAMWRAVPR
jgi:hypothetical protein